MQHLRTPVDLISLPCISAADVQQAIDTAYPFDKQGFIIFSDTAPDVVADPVLAYFFWMKTVASVPNKEVYYYYGGSWNLLPLLDGSKLLDGSVTLGKINLTGSLPYYIIQVNALGTALIWTSIVNAIQDNTLPPAKMLNADVVNPGILTSIGGVKAFTTNTAFFAGLAANLIKIGSLIRGGADSLGFYLRTKLDGSDVEWANVDVANLKATGGVAGQAIRRNAGNTAWEYFAPADPATPNFLNPQITIYSGVPAAWATYAGSIPLLTGKKAVILQGETIWLTTIDGTVTIEGRSNSLSPSLIVNRIGSVDAAQGAGQAIVPVDSAAGTFDFQSTVVSSGAPVVTTTLKMVGYIG